MVHVRQIYQLKISLLESEPTIWRQVLMPSDVRLAQLHDIIQDVMGWTNTHLYAFEIGGEYYEEPDPDTSGRNAQRTTLQSLGLQVGDAFEYTYDFGDDWRHEVRLEAIVEPTPEQFYPHCIAGARACPPEDSGGLPGLAEVLAVVADPE